MIIFLSSILLTAAVVQQPASVPITPPRNELERRLLAPGDDVLSNVQAWVDANTNDPDALQSAMTEAGFGPARTDAECWFRRYERIVAPDGLRRMATIRFCEDRKPFAFVLIGYPYPSRAPQPGEPGAARTSSPNQ